MTDASAIGRLLLEGSEDVADAVSTGRAAAPAFMALALANALVTQVRFAGLDPDEADRML